MEADAVMPGLIKVVREDSAAAVRREVPWHLSRGESVPRAGAVGFVGSVGVVGFVGSSGS